MSMFPEGRSLCELCGNSLVSDTDTAPEIFEIRVKQFGPEWLDMDYGFIVCHACKSKVTMPLLRAWAAHRFPQEIDGIKSKMAELGLNKGDDR